MNKRFPKFGLRPAITGGRASLSALSMPDFPDRSKPDPLSSSNPVRTAGRAACFRSSKAAPARSNPAPRSCPALRTFRDGGQPEYPLAVSAPMHCGPRLTPATTRSLSRPMAFPETAPAISGCVGAYPHSWTSWSNASNSVLMPDSSPAAASISVSTALRQTPPPASTAPPDTSPERRTGGVALVRLRIPTAGTQLTQYSNIHRAGSRCARWWHRRASADRRPPR